MKQPDLEAEDYTLVFRQSVRGLEVGAAVDFRGVPLGEVTRIGTDYDPVRLAFTTPVDVRIYPGRLRARLRHEVPAEPPASTEARLQRFVEHGLRAQLRSDNLLTGRLYVALDFYPLAPHVRLDPARHPREIPTLPADDLGASLADAAKKIDRLPLGQVGQVIGDLRQVLGQAGTVLADADAAVKQFGPSSSKQAELDEALQQITRAARSLRALTDSLERHPESLIRGRKRGSR
jgi:paraquat-inducible protein B